MKTIKYLPLIVCTLIVTACGGGGGGSNDDTADTTAPQISAINPIDGAVDVDPSINPSVTFNEDIFGVTINDAEFTLAKGNENVAGEVSFDGANNIATFEPVAPLALLTDYTASLSADITDLSGNALAASSWAFTTRDGQWQAPVLLGTSSFEGVVPQIATDSEGNAIAVWAENTGMSTNIRVSHFTRLNGWEASVVVFSSRYISAAPLIAIDNGGNALILWTLSVGLDSQVLTKRFTPADGWDEDAVLVSDANSQARSPQLAIDAADNAVAVWVERFSGRDSIWTSRFTPTNGSTISGWSKHERITTPSQLENAGAPQLALDASGNGLVVWIHNEIDTTQYDLWSSHYTPGVGWSEAELIETDNINDVLSPQIAFNNNGTAMAIWYKTSLLNGGVWANRFTSTDGWEEPQRIDSGTGTSPFEIADEPQIAIDSEGEALAVWRKQNNIWSNRFSPTNGWDVAERIRADNSGFRYFVLSPKIASDDAGNSLLIWLKQGGSLGLGLNVVVNRFTPDNGWGETELIETDDRGDVSWPNIALDSQGNGLAIWLQFDGSGYNILSNRFE